MPPSTIRVESNPFEMSFSESDQKCSGVVSPTAHMPSRRNPIASVLPVNIKNMSIKRTLNGSQKNVAYKHFLKENDLCSSRLNMKNKIDQARKIARNSRDDKRTFTEI